MSFYFWFDLFLEAMTGILAKKSLVCWSIWSRPNLKAPEGRFEINWPLKKKKPGLHSLRIKRAALIFSIRSLKDLDLNECSNVNFVPKLTRTKLRQLGAIRWPPQPPQPPPHPPKKNMNVVMPFSKTNWNFKITWKQLTSTNVTNAWLFSNQNQGNLLKGIVIWFVRREGIERIKRVISFQ